MPKHYDLVMRTAVGQYSTLNGHPCSLPVFSVGRGLCEAQCNEGCACPGAFNLRQDSGGP